MQGSCAASLNGENYVFGAEPVAWQSQLSKIEGCSLNRIGTLDFNFKFGSCRTYDFDGIPKILLCFDINQPQACRT